MTICAAKTKEAGWGFCFGPVTDATNVPPHYTQIEGRVHTHTTLDLHS